VAEYTSDIRHIAGAANVVADTLSRLPRHAAAEGPPSVATCLKAPSGSQVVALQGNKLNSSPPSLPGVAASVADMQPAVGVSFHRMAANQASRPSMLQAANSSSLTVRTVQIEGASLLCNVARGITWTLVPQCGASRHTFYQEDDNCIFRVEGRWQPCAGIVRSAREGRFTISQQLPCKPFPCLHASSPTCTWTSLALYQPHQTYLLTIIDRSTRWFEAVPLRNMEASTCADAFIAKWVARFGVLATVNTDRGPSSLLLCGRLPARAWASSSCSLQLTIPIITGWLSACTGNSRMPYVHIEWVQRGTPILPGC
jgi:hypothetical protein